MPSNNFKAGVVGCGRIGSLYDENDNVTATYTHAGMYSNTVGIDLVCGVDPDVNRLSAFGQHWKCDNLFTDLKTMLDECPVDVLSVTTPDHLHYEVIAKALSAAKPPALIMAEKPLAPTYQEGRKLLEIAKQAGTTLLVNYIRRWDVMHQQVRTMISRGDLGDLFHITGYYVRGIRHNGCHMVNMMRYLAGEIVETEIVGRPDRGSFEQDPSLHARVVFESGAEGTIVGLDQKQYSYSIFDIDIFGTKGRVRITADGTRAEIMPSRTDSRFPDFKTLAPEPVTLQSTYETAMLNAGTGLLSLLQSPESKPVNHASEALADMQVIESLLSKCSKSENKQ